MVWNIFKRKAKKEVFNENEFMRQLFSLAPSKGNINQNYDTKDFVKNGYAGNADVYSIINYIITTASNVKFKAEIYNTTSKEWEVDEGSQLIKLLNKPNPITSGSLFIEEVIGWKLIDGNAYIYAPRIKNGVNKGKTLELWVMPSAEMQVITGGIMEPIKGFTYTSWDKPISKDDVMMLRYFNPSGSVDNSKASIFTGQSSLKAGEMLLKKLNTGALSEISAFENNGALGVFSSEDEMGFSQTQAKNLEEQFKKTGGGANNKNTVKFTSARVKYHKLGDSPADMKVVESSLAAKRQLASMLKFPVQLLNDPDGATFSNQNEAHKALYTNLIIPEMRSIGEGIANWLGESYYPNKQVRILPDTSGIDVLQANRKEQAEALEKAWWIKGTDKQRIMGAPIDPEMDKYFIPANLINIESFDMTDEELQARIDAAKILNGN